MSFKWARRVVGRNHQSVTDYDLDALRTEESLKLEAPGTTARPPQPSLPVNVSGVTGFQNLPDELLEQIFQKLSGSSRRNYFAVSGVSRSWRRLGNKMFFSSPWDTPHLICHPNQLFCLSPRTPSGSRSGLLKCFVRRDTADHILPNGRVGRRISFFLGKDPLNTSRARFLLCAIQPSRHETLIYLNSKCDGEPCARLVSNFLCTSYSLENGMTFSLEGPNCSIPTSTILNNNNTMFSNNISAGGGGDGEDGNTTTTTPAGVSSVIESGEDEITSILPNEQVSTPPSPSSSSIVPIIPPLLMSLRYRARVRGLMQPRRMDAALPNPNFMACGALLKMQRVSATSTGTLGTGNGGADSSNSGAPVVAFSSSSSASPSASPFQNGGVGGSGDASMMLQRPSLGHISSVAALERPPVPEESQHQSSSTTTTTTTAAVGGDKPTSRPVVGNDNGAGPSYSSPSSAYNSLATSPESLISLSEASSPTPAMPAGIGAIAPAPAPAAAAQSSGGSAGNNNTALSLWRRFIGFDRSPPAGNHQQRRGGGLSFNFYNLFSFSSSSASGSSNSFLRARRGATFDESALPVCLVNKSPHWNEALRCWCLNFRGRVKLASVKNFQLVKDGDEEAKVSMQFGKYDKDLFILDFNPMTLSAIQAFAIALTTFDSKVTL